MIQIKQKDLEDLIHHLKELKFIDKNQSYYEIEDELNARSLIGFIQ